MWRSRFTWFRFFPPRPAPWESEFGDAGFVEFSEPTGDHFAILAERGGGQGQFQFELPSQAEGDAAVLGRMRGTEEARVIAVDHVLAVGGQNPGVGPGLAKHLHEGLKIEAQGSAQPESLRKAGGVDVHHHVDQSFDFRRAAGRSDIAHEFSLVAQFGQDRGDAVEGLTVAAAHQIECAGTGLRDGGGHAALERGGVCFFRQLLHGDMGGRRDGGAIDEHLAGRSLEQVVFRSGKDAVHGFVVRHHREDQVGRRGDPGQGGTGLTAQFLGQILRDLTAHVVDDDDVVAGFLEATCHVGAHAAKTDDADSFHGGVNG